MSLRKREGMGNNPAGSQETCLCQRTCSPSGQRSGAAAILAPWCFCRGAA